MLTQLFISALLMSAIYGFIATGIVLLFKTANIRSFAQGEILMVSAFSATTFYTTWHLPYALSFILTIGVGVGVGILMEVLVFRKIRNKVENHVLACLVSTLGLSVFLRNAAYFIWGYQPKSLPSPFGRELITILGVNITYESLFLLILVFITLISLQIFLNKTHLGKSMKATAQNRDLANLIGIETNRTVLITCGLAGGLGGLSGLMLGPLYLVSNDMGAMVGIKAFMAAVIGGFGNPIGALIGAAIVGFIETFGAAFISSSYKDLITFCVLILMLVFKPTGILGED